MEKKLNDLNIAVVDTETTGLDPAQHEIIEIAAIIYNPRDKIVVKEWVRKAAPRNIETANPVALEMNGYNENPNSYADDINEVMTEFVSVAQGTIICGQNIQFDLRFIEKYYNEFNLASPIHRHRKLELSSLVWPALSNATDMKLATICDIFNVSNEDEHSALIDCRRTLAVYQKYMELIEKVI